MIVVIADDLSGAAELAGVALRHGLSAEVQVAFSADTDADVICVDTDTRLRSAAEAASVAAAVTRAVVTARPTWIFKKCDSVLRGHVLAEARAIASAAGNTRIVILSANPSRGRVICSGEYLIEGVRLPQTLFAHDPAHPRTTACVAALLGGDLNGVATPDAATATDVARVAATVDTHTLPVGAVDFFDALLAARRSTGVTPTARVEPESIQHSPALIVCGSTASWAQRRAEAAAQGIPVFALPHDVAAAAGALQTHGRALIGIGDGPATHGHSPTELVGQLAASVAAILRQTMPARLLLEGGATTAAVMRALGWTRLRASEISAQGIGVLRSARSGSPLLCIKPGSYPWPPELWPTKQ